MKQCLDSIISPEMYKEVFAYDNSGNNTLYVNYYWDENSWKGSIKKVLQYDANGNNTLYASYNWDYEKNEWALSSQEEFE